MWRKFRDKIGSLFSKKEQSESKTLVLPENLSISFTIADNDVVVKAVNVEGQEKIFAEFLANLNSGIYLIEILKYLESVIHPTIYDSFIQELSNRMETILEIKSSINEMDSMQPIVCPTQVFMNNSHVNIQDDE